MKKSFCTLLTITFLFTIFFIPAIPTASAGDLPKLITFTSYKVGSLGYTLTSGFREAIEQLTPMKVRVEPYDTDVARVLPLRSGESEMSILTGATGTCASYGIADFGTKAWGPQPIRQVWRGLSLYLSFLTRADSGIKTIEDVRGKRVPKVPGWPAGMRTIEGIMAFGNLTWKDVKAVPQSGYVNQLKGVIQGSVDVCYAATVTPTVKELQAGPHKAAWIRLPHSDKAAWKRCLAKAPWFIPAVCKRAPGLPKGETMEVGGYPYSLWAYATVDPDVIYNVVKAMDKGYKYTRTCTGPMPGLLR